VTDSLLPRRLALRERPGGVPIMHQTWERLLFLHWPVAPASLRALVPAGLELDVYDGAAWVSLTPFTIRGMRPPFLPTLPGLGDSHELNVRTYVHHDGVPGVWFFSLDASNPLFVAASRAVFHLPYWKARMSLRQERDEIAYQSIRVDSRAARAELDVRWRFARDTSEAEPGSLAFFLVERYCLYARTHDALHRARIAHRPWRLQPAHLLGFRSSMFEAAGIETPAAAPLLQYAESLDVEIWPLTRVR
jgi:uncharacterized protein YqjF (DUF2071 family)